MGPGIYSFAHKSIAEYLVAQAILEGDQRDASDKRIDRFLLFEHRDDDRWNTVTFLWAGLAPIADVEDFIQICIEAESWELAYGILYDMYERIPKNIRRSLILKLMSGNNFSMIVRQGQFGCMYWAVSQPYNQQKIKLVLPTFRLRSLLPFQHFHNLIIRAVEDDTVTWSDEPNTNGEWRNLLWMSVVLQPNNIERWKACLRSPCPKSELSTLWQLWVAERIFLKALQEEIINIKLVVLAYQEVFPQARSLLPFTLMSSFITYISINLDNLEQTKSHSRYKNLDRILDVFSYIDIDEDDDISEWLLRSRWSLIMNQEIGYSDLLVVFTEKMEELVNKGYIKPNETYKCAIEFVKDLQKQRETLEVQQDNLR